MRLSFLLAMVVCVVCCGVSLGQSPGTIYTWNGTGNTRDWRRGGTSFALLSNTTAGVLTVTEVGDEFDPGSTDPTFFGQDVTFADGFNRVRESSFSAGGLDVTGLDFLELDLSHNGTGPVNVQFFVQVGFNAEVYTWADLPDTTITPSTTHTLQFPLSALTPAQRAYIRSVGVSVRDHPELGYLTWTVSELRSVGTPLTVRDLATHDVGSSDNGFNGAYANYGLDAIIGNDGGQNQTGLSINTSGSGSLQWTDNGAGTTMEPSGGAVSWGNGTEFFSQNSFFERPADFSNYDTVTYRISATDVVPGGGGMIGIQGFFQTDNYAAHQVAATLQLPVDGQFHDLVYPLAAITNRNVVDAFGLDLNEHPNDVVINVDLVRFEMSQTLPGDFNGDGNVDAADYVVWRKTDGTLASYNEWRDNFGETAGSGSLGRQSAVPEPSAVVLLLTVALAVLMRGRRCA
jgi:hypothetical protein